MTVGVAAQLDLPAQRAQVALPEGVPRGYHLRRVEDLPAAGARRRRCQGPRDRQPLDHAVRTAAPACRVHVRCLTPRSLGQVLAVLAAQVPLPPQRRGVQVLLQVPVQRCCKGPRPAMWVAFCKLRRCLKPARKDRRARLARIQLELHLACTSGRGSGPAACTHTARTRPVCALAL